MGTGAYAVANHLLALARTKGKTITPLQLMKLVYISHGWSLGLTNNPLITDSIEAWRYGPVIPDLYQATKKYGDGPITEDIQVPWRRKGELTDTDRSIIDQVYKIYGTKNGIQLSALTHKSGTPWEITWSENKMQNAEIPNDLIAEHYRKLASERATLI